MLSIIGYCKAQCSELSCLVQTWLQLYGPGPGASSSEPVARSPRGRMRLLACKCVTVCVCGLRPDGPGWLLLTITHPCFVATCPPTALGGCTGQYHIAPGHAPERAAPCSPAVRHTTTRHAPVGKHLLCAPCCIRRRLAARITVEPFATKVSTSVAASWSPHLLGDAAH